MIGFAQLATERVLNSLPEGLLIALGAWLLLRVMGRQNSGTRFAVWMVALGGVVALPILSTFGIGSHGLIAYGHPEIAVPGYWAIGFFVFWVGIGSLVLARVAAGLWQVRQLRRTCREIAISDLDAELQEVLQQTKRRVRLVVSEKARVPAAVGFRKAAIVLPAWSLEELSADELKPILIHELAHLRRHDDWTNLVQKVLRAVFFFHPAVWWIDARLSQERELACDDAVLVATGNARAYAGCLMDLLERGCARRGWAMAQALVAHARDASTRIARILQGGTPKTTRVGRVALGMAAMLSVACAGIAACAPSLVGFEPEHTVASASLIEPGAGHALRPPRADVVPAAFHPEKLATRPQKEFKRHTAERKAAPPMRMADLQRPAPRRSPAAPVVMARYASPETTHRTAAATTLMIYSRAASGDKPAGQGSVRPAAAVLAVNVGAAAPFPLQVMQIVMRDSEGNVQVIRVEVLLVVPPQGMQAQSI